MSNPEGQQARGNWNQFKGRVKEAWGALSDDDVDRFEGRLDQLAGYIQEKTGEGREAIREKLDEFMNDAPDRETRPNAA
ncbi:MAG: CsbD family protein [Rhodothermales bacterium]|nr:CsbD family protein [Rhodothermales bacterium]